MSYSSFVFESRNGVSTIRLNDPEKLNALTFETYRELENIMADLAHDRDVKVVVITGTGKGFCSGGSVHDIIGPLLKMTDDERYQFTRMTCNVVKNMRQPEKADPCGCQWHRRWSRRNADVGLGSAHLLGSSSRGISLRQGRPVRSRYGRTILAAENSGAR